MASQGSPAADVRGAQAMELDDVVMTEHRQAEGGDSGSSVRPGARPAQEEPPLRSPSPEEAQKLDDLKALMPSRALDKLKYAISQRGNDDSSGSIGSTLSESLDGALKEAERIHDLRSRTESLPAWLQRLCLDDNGNPRKSKAPKELFDLFKDWTPPAKGPRSHRTCARLLLYLLNNGIQKVRIFDDFDQTNLTTLSKAFLTVPVLGRVHLALLEKIAAYYDPMFFPAGESSSDSKIDSSSKSKIDSSSKSEIDSSSKRKRNHSSKSKGDSSNERRFKHYGPTVHVVQSSGTGKSRLVNEICKMLPGISICFREPGETLQAGFPLGDDVMTRFCLGQTGPHHKRQAAAIALLAALLEKLAHEPGEVGEGFFWSEWGLKLVEDPSKPDDEKRSGFFDKVVERATSLLDGSADEVAKGAGLTEMSTFTSSLCQIWCVSAANALAKRIEKAKTFDDVPSLHLLDPDAREYYRSKAVLFLGLDEATFLDEPPSEGSAPRHGIHLIHFRRALFELAMLEPKLRIWTILIDTFAGVDTIIAPVKPSRRTESHPPLPPFVSLPFDIFAGEDSSPPEKAKDFLTYARLRKIGRPLWGTLEMSDKAIVSYAETKLFQSETFDAANKDHVVAAFSRRLWLELNVPQEYVGRKRPNEVGGAQAHALYGLSITAVRSHLRIVDNLDAPSRNIATKNGSEPIVSIAAYQALMEPDTYAAALMTLVNDLNMLCKLLNRGDLGELFMRLILILARDFAYAEIDKSPTATRKEVVALPTVDFLRKLLGTDFGLPEPKEAEELKRRVENTYISFTHFAAAPRYDKEITARNLLSYWTRTVALQCEHNQMGVDAIIPIYRGSPNDPFNPKSLSYIGFQVKLRQSSTQPTWTVKLSPNGTSGGNSAPAIESVKGNVWGPAIVGGTFDRERPLVIVMDLGVSRDTTPSNRLYIGTGMEVSTSIAASKTLEENREARQVSPDVHRAELKKLAREWLCEHHGQSTADFAALHVSGLKDAYEGLFGQALGGQIMPFFHTLRPLIAQNLRWKNNSDDEIEFKASQDASYSKHIQCVPHC